jgi:hypothetical protein
VLRVPRATAITDAIVPMTARAIRRPMTASKVGVLIQRMICAP